MKKQLLTLTVLISFVVAQAQVIIPKTEDSLLLFFKKYPKTDTAYIWGLRKYALLHVYTKPNFKKADSLADEIEKLSVEKNYGRGIYFAYMVKAINRNDKDMFQEALVYFTKCLQTVDEYKLSKLLKEASLFNISLVYNGLGNKQKAIEYSLKAIEFQEKNKLKPLDASPYGMIGYILKSEGKFKEAKQYYDKELKIAIENKNDVQICASESTLGSWYLEQKLYPEAINHFEKVLVLTDKTKYWQMKMDALIGLGRIYDAQKKYTLAEKFFKESEKICSETQSIQGLQMTYLYEALMFKNKGNNALAENNFRLAYGLKDKNDDLKDKFDVIKAMADFYGEQKQYEKSYIFLKEAGITLDSLNKRESEKIKQELLTKYETEQKETQIKLLEEETKASNWQRNAFLVGGILVLILAVVSFAFLLNRNKLKRYEEEQKLRNRIASDLHDEIGSTLSSISILSEIVSMQQKKGDFKPDIMQQVSHDSREVIEKMDDIIWTINPENDSFYNLETRLKTFAIPLFELKDIEFKFEFSKDLENIKIDMSKRRDIYLILKEAINNLVKYSQCKNATISAFQKDDGLIMSVVDDGVGFDINAETQRNGLRNMKHRADKIGGDLAINSEIEKGTEVVLIVML